jgi:hypothetical protein
MTSESMKLPPLAVIDSSPTSTPGSVDFPMLPGFSFSRELWYFSGLQRAGKAPISASKNPIPGFSAFFREFPVLKCPL